MERRFPMPDYEIDNEKKEVAVRIYGNAINERYTKLLKDNDNLTLHDCISSMPSRKDTALTKR